MVMARSIGFGRRAGRADTKMGRWLQSRHLTTLPEGGVDERRSGVGQSISPLGLNGPRWL